MKRAFVIEGCLATRRDGWRRHAALLALALAVPGVAHPFSLDQLLRLPLEQLLQLEISSRRVACAARDNAWAARCPRADGSAS